MTRRARIAFLTGGVLMAAGTLLPWATAQTWSGSFAVSGYDGHGAFETVLLAALVCALAFARWEAGAVVAAAAAATWTAYLMWALPGALTSDGAYQAQLELGAGMTTLGAFVVACAAGMVVLRHIEAGLVAASARHTARRA
ncbi:MAG TPA: hypothetical protein VNT55_19930 [Baekduia sp.]|nr:hypothetical protein [Baekduia sp.]